MWRKRIKKQESAYCSRMRRKYFFTKHTQNTIHSFVSFGFPYSQYTIWLHDTVSIFGEECVYVDDELDRSFAPPMFLLNYYKRFNRNHQKSSFTFCPSIYLSQCKHSPIKIFWDVKNSWTLWSPQSLAEQPWRKARTTKVFHTSQILYRSVLLSWAN